MNPDQGDGSHPFAAASLVYDADACRAWLECGVADEQCIGEMSTINLTMAAGVDRLLEALDLQPEPAVWRTTGTLQRV